MGIQGGNAPFMPGPYAVRAEMLGFASGVPPVRVEKPAMRIRGFSLVELSMVMVITGILAVAAISRFFDRQTFESRGFYDETLAALRYAQKTAIAQRRNVCVTFTTSSATLTIASAFGSACDTDLTGPTGTTPFAVTARS